MRILFLLLITLTSIHTYGQNNVVYHKKIQKILNKQALCIGPTNWPISIDIGSDLWINAQMQSFVDAGLAISQKEKGRIIWTLSESGHQAFIKGNGFCYGTMIVRSIKDVQLSKNGLITVIFTYSIEDLPNWAENPSIRFSNTDLDNLISGIDNIRYQAILKEGVHGNIKLDGELEQLELYY